MFRTFLGGHLRASCGCLAYRRSPYIYGRSIISVRPLSSPSSQLPIISLHYDQLAAGHTTFIRWEAAAGKVAWVRTRRPEMYATLGDRVASLARYVRIYTTYVDRGSAGPTRSRLRGRSFRARCCWCWVLAVACRRLPAVDGGLVGDPSSDVRQAGGEQQLASEPREGNGPPSL